MARPQHNLKQTTKAPRWDKVSVTGIANNPNFNANNLQIFGFLSIEEPMTWSIDRRYH
jgi:hypothetical protein